MAICIVYIKTSTVVEGRVGWGCIVKTPRGEVWELAGMVPLDEDVTTSRSTLMGIVVALETLPKPATVEVHTDFKYIAEGYRDSLDQWASKNWNRTASKPIAHADLWQRIVQQRERHRLSFFWVQLDGEHRRLAALAKRGRAGEKVFLRHAPPTSEGATGSPVRLIEHDELHRNLRYYLQQAAHGYETVVTVDGIPVAAVVPYLSPAPSHADSRQAELGVISDQKSEGL